MKLGEKVRSWLVERRARSVRLANVYGLNRRNLELIYEHNPRRHYPIADDKILAKEYLVKGGVCVPETLAVCRGLFEVEPTLRRLQGESDFVVKPASGSGGAGIVVLGRRCPNGWETVRQQVVTDADLVQHVAQIVFGAYTRQMEDQALIERRIVPHELLHELWPDGVSDLRVIVLRDRPLLAMLRVPTHRSRGKANLHQGGIGVAVDIASGRTTRAVSGRVTLERHPESGVALIGRLIPSWSEVLELAMKAAASVPLGYLGVDIALDRTLGPLVLEINARPGLEIQNVNAIALGAVIPRGGTS